MIVIDPRPYLIIPFVLDGRTRRGVDCWGLHRLIVEDVTGLRLDEHGGLAGYHAYARRLKEQQQAPDWQPVKPGAERPTDLVLMTGYVRATRGLVSAPLHVGTVLEPGLLIDTEEDTGTMVRPFRSTLTRTVLPTLAHRVLGIYRHHAVERWWNVGEEVPA